MFDIIGSPRETGIKTDMITHLKRKTVFYTIGYNVESAR